MEEQMQTENNPEREAAAAEIQKELEYGSYDTARVLSDAYRKRFGYDKDIAILESALFLAAGDPPAALARAEAGLACSPCCYELYMTLGEAWEALGNRSCAELCYSRAVTLCGEPADKTYLKQNLETFRQAGETLPGLTVLLRASGDPGWLSSCLQQIDACTETEVPGRTQILLLGDAPATLPPLSGQCSCTVLPLQPKDTAQAWNTGLEHADPDSDILIIEEGGLPLTQTFFLLRLALYAEPSAGITGAVSSLPVCDKYRKHTLNGIEDSQAYADRYNIPDSSAAALSLDLPGPICLLKRSFLKRFGWFDDDFGLSCQLEDYCFRLTANGKKVLLCQNVLCASLSENSRLYTQTDLEHFDQKWQIDLTYSRHSRDDVADMIPYASHKTGSCVNILEVGCACGATLLEIKRRFSPACEVRLFGIEIGEGPASIAGRFASVSNEDVEQAFLPYPEASFDYIIFADVLEHLRNPGTVLQNVKRFLKERGRILSSLPNIMHISVMKQLLAGRFIYEDAGILDRTHLRFFTYVEILNLFQEAGYLPEGVYMKAVALSEEDLTLCRQLASIQSVPESWFQAYQYLVLAQKQSEKN